LSFPCSVTDPDPEGSETFGRIRSGTEINVSDPDSNPYSNPDPKLDEINFRLKLGSFILLYKINIYKYLYAVLWIRDILVWIRIRGSVPLTYGSGSESFKFIAHLVHSQITELREGSLFIFEDEAE
jgi:hypothetical protein